MVPIAPAVFPVLRDEHVVTVDGEVPSVFLGVCVSQDVPLVLVRVSVVVPTPGLLDPLLIIFVVFLGPVLLEGAPG